MRLLVAGIGNVFLGDDGFGVAVAERLLRRSVPEGVQVVDFGIRGFDLAFALERCDAAILVDALPRGGRPGTLYVLEPEPPSFQSDITTSGSQQDDSSPDGSFEMHSMTPDQVLRWMRPGAGPSVMRVVGCEPETFGPEGVGQDHLSGVVEEAIDKAVGLVEGLITELLGSPIGA